MNYKRILSATVATVIALTAVLVPSAGNRMKISAPEVKHSENENLLSGSNSFGNYISKLSSENEGEAEEKNISPYFRLYEAVYNEAVSELTVKTGQTSSCRLRVSILSDDEEMKVLRTMHCNVDKDTEETAVSIDCSGLPEYFFIEAVLVGPIGEKLCEPFYVNTCTRTVKYAESVTVNDFSEKYTVNLDGNEDKNFFVLNEDTVIAESSEDVNVLVGADYENGVFVFEKADETLENLNSGDYLYIQPDEENIIAVSVDRVDVSGDTVTVSDSGGDIDEMFDFIKIKQIYVCDTATAGDSSDSEEKENPFKLGFDLNEGFLKAEAKVEAGYEAELQENVKAGVKGELCEKLEINIYKYKEDIEACVVLDSEFTLSASMEGEYDTSKDDKMENKLTFFDCKIPTEIPGLMVDIKADLFVKAEGKFGVTGTITNKSGFIYNCKTGFSEIEDPGTSKSMKVSAEGAVSAGVKIKIGIDLFHEEILHADVNASIGIELAVEAKCEFNDVTYETLYKGDAFYLPDHNEDRLHACLVCYNGGLSAFVSLGAEFKVFGVSFPFESERYKFPIARWYASEKGAGFGECPNYLYRADFIVTNDGVNVSGGILKSSGAECGISDGVASMYFRNRISHLYSVLVPDINGKLQSAGSGSFQIEDATNTVYFEMVNGKRQSYSNSKGEPDTYEKISLEKQKAVQAKESDYKTASMSEGTEILDKGALGDNISFFLYANGNMTIYGSGIMKDYSESIHPFRSDVIDKIKNISIEYSPVGPITNIGQYVFSGCKNAEYITIPEEITTIGEGAFAGCEKLSKIMYPEKKDEKGTISERPYDFKNVISIGKNAFLNCSVMPNRPEFSSLKELGESAFKGCTNLSGSLEFRNIAELPYESFFGCEGITDVVTDNVKIIAMKAFSECTGLKKFVVKNGIDTIIGNGNVKYYKDGYIVSGAFAGCIALEEIEMPVMTTSIVAGNNNKTPDSVITLFSGKDCNLKKVILTAGTSVTKDLFRNVTSLQEVIIPEEVDTFEASAFLNCSSLEKINLKNIKEYGSEAMSGCTSLSGVLDLSTAETIGSQAFNGCTGITEVLTSNINKMGNESFAGCANISKVVIGNGIDKIIRAAMIKYFETGYIVSGAFKGCTSLEEIEMPALETTLYSANNNKTPDSVISLFFNECNAKKITVTTGTEISKSLFRDVSSMSQIVIPGDINHVLENAFSGCTGLTDVYFGGSEEEWKQVVIDKDNDPLLNATIHFAKKSKNIVGSVDFDPERDEPLRGSADINGDKKVDITDLSYLSIYLIKDIEFTDKAKLVADIDKDGEVNLADLASLKMILTHNT